MSHVPTLPEHGPLKTNVEDLLALLGRPHMLALIYVVNVVVTPPVRFNELQAHLQTSPTTLTARIKEAVNAGLLERIDHGTNPPRVEYAPTEALQELEPAFVALNYWCKRHALAPQTAANQDSPQ